MQHIETSTSCPHCAHLPDGGIGVRDHDAIAEPGGLSICACCFRLSRFDAMLRLVPLTLAAESAALDDPAVRAARDLLRSIADRCSF